MLKFNSESDRASRAIEDALANLQTLPSTFTLREGKRLIKVINFVLTDLHNEDNLDKGMADLLVKNPKQNSMNRCQWLKISLMIKS